jgi:hypothetical protein
VVSFEIQIILKKGMWAVCLSRRRGLELKRVEKHCKKKRTFCLLQNKRKNLKSIKPAQQRLTFLQLNSNNSEVKELVMPGTSGLPCKDFHTSLKL